MLKADEAVITTVGQGASAVFENAGAKWTGTFDLSSYAVEIDAPESGVVGTFHLKSLAPAEYVFPLISSLVKQFLMFSKLCMRQSTGRAADDGGAKRWLRLGKNSLISGIDRNRCQNRKVSIVSIVLSILSQYLPYF